MDRPSQIPHEATNDCIDEIEMAYCKHESTSHHQNAIQLLVDTVRSKEARLIRQEAEIARLRELTR